MWTLYAAKDNSRSKGGSKYLKLSCMQAGEQAYRSAYRKSMAHRSSLEFEQQFNHPLMDLLSYGNEMMDGNAVLRVTQTHIDLAGEGFWYLEKDPKFGVPSAIWPIPPHWVMNFPTRDHMFYKLRYLGQEIEIPVTHMVAFINPNPANPYGRGRGLGRAIADELETDEYASKHTKNFFYNQARPDVIVSGASITRDDANRLENQWNSKFRGFWQAWKPYFLTRDIKVHQLTQGFENLHMIELRKFNRDMFISVLGAPREKFGIVNESKRATIAAADMFWNKDIISPRVNFLRGIIQRELVPLFDERLILDFESPVSEDKDYELDVMKAAPWAFTKNEWRVQAGKMDLGEAGEVFHSPLNAVEFGVDEGMPEVKVAAGAGSDPNKVPEESGDGTNPADNQQASASVLTFPSAEIVTEIKKMIIGPGS